jgi:hypothetical protein
LQYKVGIENAYFFGGSVSQIMVAQY